MVQGERPWSIQATVEEAAAREFMTLDGLGEAAAMALSLSTSLGGQRHPSLSSLKSWLAADDEHPDVLKAFLLDRYFIPMTSSCTLLCQKGPLARND